MRSTFAGQNGLRFGSQRLQRVTRRSFSSSRVRYRKGSAGSSLVSSSLASCSRCVRSLDSPALMQRVRARMTPFDPRLAPIYRNRPDWLPAVEVRGEGIFIELDESAVAAWEGKADVQSRSGAMAEKFRQWETERGSKPSPFPGARYVLLHSLAHTLIRQLSLNCGYSASSVRERIYSSSDPEAHDGGYPPLHGQP